MEKLFYIKVDCEDWRFNPNFDDLYVTSYEKWKEVVKKDIYDNKEKYYKYFMKNEFIKDDEFHGNFDKWVEFHIDFDSYCKEVQISF